MKLSAARRPLQVAAFLRKEVIDALRQPRLLMMLVIGPFLIMAIFGLGYRDTPEKLRTVFVAPAGSVLLDNVDDYAEQIGDYIKFSGSTTDFSVARRQLLDGKIDLIVSFPDDPLQTVLSGQPASITIVHTRLDPIEQTAISFASQLGIDQINGQIVAKVVGGAQSAARPLGDLVTDATAALDKLESASAAGDTSGASAAAAELDDVTAQISIAARASSAVIDQLSSTQADAQQTALSAVEELRSLAERVTADPSTAASSTPRLRELLSTISDDYAEFTSVDPEVLVQPFTSEVELAAPRVNKVTDWYAPAAIVLMLQQFGVAFGALSFVRERELGIVDVLRIAPINAPETLLGKYLAYLVIGGGIATLLTALVVKVLDVPIAASVSDVAIVLGLTLFASIGLGFVISLISKTDSQAVQYTMILLLASLFFSGFFLSVGHMEGAARFIGWLLPVTYGMELLRDVMLRGTGLDRDAMLGLIAYGVVAFALALFGTRRRMALAT